MSRYTIEASAWSSAPRETVWEVLADHRHYAEWGLWKQSELEREGSPAPNGVGAVRRLIRRPTVSREEITVFEPPQRLTYDLLSGLPVHNYRAEVTLAEESGGTEIRWRSEFDAGLLGPAMKAFLGRAISDTAKGAAREAERR